jgi:hypothetical protein
MAWCSFVDGFSGDLRSRAAAQSLVDGLLGEMLLAPDRGSAPGH